MRVEHLVGRCLFCGKSWGPFDTSPARSRFCCTKGLERTFQALENVVKLFPTIYPFPAVEDQDAFAPPHPAASDVDVFAVMSPTRKRDSTTPELPYPRRCGPLRHLKCGNASLYNLGDRASSFGFAPNSITVCDMSTYLWSNTLKDPRSWAVVRTAIAAGIRHLGVWTAGNAGLSLTKLAYAANRMLPQKDRLHVYAYGVRNEFHPELQRAVQRFHGRVSIFGSISGEILLPTQAVDRLNSSLPLGERIRTDEYWDVSDGWDGVALYMYRLLGRQICVHLKPDYIVAPVGTGDLFFGLYLGRNDALAAGHITNTDCRMVAAVPLAESILDNYSRYNLNVPSVAPTEGGKPPIAPKLSTSYTPLLFVMYPALRDTSVTVAQVSMEEQEWAADLLLSQPDRSWASAEPSALVAFAALHGLSRRHQLEQGGKGSAAAPEVQASVVVVNSGCGSVSRGEAAFMARRSDKVGTA